MNDDNKWYWIFMIVLVLSAFGVLACDIIFGQEMINISEEEKKAKEYWQYIRDTQIYDGYKGQVYAVVLLNLVEKQEKELKKLKKQAEITAKAHIELTENLDAMIEKQ